MKKISLKSAFFCARTEFVKWLLDARMIILVVLLIFIYNLVIVPLVSNAALMHEPINVFEPFIAVANSGAVLLIIPLVFMTLIADFPRIDTSTVFYIYRIGRVSWLTGQILKLVFMGLFFLTVIFVGTVVPVISDSFISDSWSNVATKFAIYYPEKSGNFGVRLLPENLYNQMSVLEAAIESYLLVFAYLMILGLILIAFSIIKKKTLGFVLCGTVISLGAALCSIRSDFMWIMPMANSIIWIHYTKYFRQPVFPVEFSVIYLCSVIVILIVFCYCAIGKFNYDNVNEVVM